MYDEKYDEKYHKREIELNKFITYCKEHLIDTYIINRCSDNMFEDIARIDIIYSDNCVYLDVISHYNSYIFRFKDDESVKQFANKNKIHLKYDKYSFDYNEPETIINGHRLKSFLYTLNNGHIYIESNTTSKLIGKMNISIIRQMLFYNMDVVVLSEKNIVTHIGVVKDNMIQWGKNVFISKGIYVKCTEPSEEITNAVISKVILSNLNGE